MYETLIGLLEATGIPAAEGAWNNAPKSGSYIVYQLDGEGASLWADDRQREQVILGSVDLFCRTNDRADFHAVQTALKASGVSWSLSSVQRERAARLVHYEWAFELERLEDNSRGVYVDLDKVSAPEISLSGGLMEISGLGLSVTDGILKEGT